MTTTPRPTASPEAEPLWTRAASIASALEVAKHLAVLQAADTPAAAVATTRHLHGIIAPGALADLHRRLDRATVSEVSACAAWLAELSPTVSIRQLEARAAATARFVEGRRSHG